MSKKFMQMKYNFKNQTFIILTVLRLSVKQVAGPIFAVQRLDNTAAQKKRRSSGKPLATPSNLTNPGFEHQISRTDKHSLRFN